MPEALDHDLRALDDHSVVWFSFDAPVADAPPRTWRSDLAPVLRAFGSGCTTEDVLVATGELVANAIEHGGGVVRLHVEGRRGTVLVEVCDHDRDLAPGPPGASTDRGYGLRMVGALADGWGWTPTGDGKSVWAWFDVKGDDRA